MDLKSLLDKRGRGPGGALLKGSDVPLGKKWITIEIGSVRESPDAFKAPIIVDFKKPVYGKLAWAVNNSNLNMLISLYGEDANKLVGKKIRLDVVAARNPQTGQTVPSLAVSPKQKKGH